MNAKKFPIGVQRKIDTINSMIESINESEAVPYTYAGGTWPYAVYIKPIVIKNQFVTIEGGKYGTYIEGKERYNVNKVSTFGDDYCRKHLEYTLGIILKTFKKTLN
jgi:hypothetical protein